MNFVLPKGYSWVDTSDEDFSKALDLILNGKKNLFINGPAGVGKSVMIQLAYKMLKGNVLVLASTGIAVANLCDADVPASTVHSGLGIPIQPIYDRETSISPIKVSLLSKIDTLIIEEVSMISSSFFDQIYRVVRKAEETRIKPIRILCFGDVLQFPPVVPSGDNTKEYFKDTYEGNVFFFNSRVYRGRGFEIIDLNKIHRRKDGSLQNVLNKIRLGMEEEEDLDFFKSRVCKIDDFIKKHPLALVIATTNARVRYLNETYGIPKNRYGHTYQAKIVGDYNFSDGGTVEYKTTIYEGQQVMCLSNDPDGLYQNGTLRRVLKVYDDSVRIAKYDGAIVTVKTHIWDQYESSYDPINKRVTNRVKGSIQQIGCKPVFVCTFHKSQGLTLDAIYLDLENKWVPESAIYIGLSRCKSIEGIGLSRPLKISDIKQNSEAFNFLYEEATKGE